MTELLPRGIPPVITDDEIETLHSYAVAHGRDDLQTLCEIAMGGSALTSPIARNQLAVVMEDIRRQRAEAARLN